MEHIGMANNAYRCRVLDCPCGYGPRPEEPVIVAEAALLGRDASLGESIREVSVWLRERAHEAGWMLSEGHRQVVALKLIQIRDYVEGKGFGRG